MKLEFRQSFINDLKGKDPGALKRLKSLIEKLEDADSLNHITNVKNLKGADGYYRIRIGNYRLGLRQEGNKIIVLIFLFSARLYKWIKFSLYFTNAGSCIVGLRRSLARVSP